MAKMFDTIKRKYYWPTLKKDIDDFVKKCPECQRNKHSRHIKLPMEPTTTDREPMSSIEMDLVGPLPTDNRDNKYILSIHCKFSRYIVAAPLPDKKAETVAKTFVDRFILVYGVPRIILTDRGKEFTASLMSELCELLGVAKMQSTAFHHQTLGLTEISHKHLGAFLRIVTNNGLKDWSDWISSWAFAYNTNVNVDTKYSPYELVFGRECRLPSSIEEEITNTTSNDNYESFINKLRNKLEVTYKDVESRLDIVRKTRKEKYDRTIRDIEFKIGDWVLVKKEVGNKLDKLFDGPFRVTNRNGSNLFIQKGSRVEEIHANRAKLFYN